jgi:putative ABC transport system permease protein
VLIVSESTSRHLWPSVDPIGKRIRIGDEKVYSEVVGVARDIYATNLSAVDGIYIYRPVDPRELRLSVLVCGKESASVAKQLRAVVAKLDPNVFVDSVELKENLKTWRAPSRILAVLSGALSLLALLLAATGIFGVINYSVSQRTQEIGTRMALGANPRSILRLLISQSLRPVFVGAALGLTAAAAVSRILSSLLFGVSPLDALTFLSMLFVLFAVAFLASYAPTARAARIEPAAALRHE